MTATTNGHDHSVTVGDDARMRVRVVENPAARPYRPGSAPGFAHARAIPQQDPSPKGNKPGKIRNFVSLHAVDAANSATAAWFLTDRPETLQTVAQRIGQLPGGSRNNAGHIAAGLIRLAVYTIAYLACLAVHTNKRAAVTATLAALVITATAVAAAVTP